MNTLILCIIPLIFFFVASQKHRSYDKAKYSSIAINDNSAYLDLPEINRGSRELDRVAEENNKDVVYDKALLKKIVKKLRDYISQVKQITKNLWCIQLITISIHQLMETYNLDASKTEEADSKTHKELHSHEKNDHHHIDTETEPSKNHHHSTAEDEENVPDVKPQHTHKNSTEETQSNSEKEDARDEDLSEKCANYEKHHKTHSKSSSDDSSKTNNDENAEFDDSYSERFLRNIPYDHNVNDDNFQ